MKFLAGAFCGVAAVLLVMSLYRRPEPQTPLQAFYERLRQHGVVPISDERLDEMLAQADDWATDPYTRGLVQ